MSFLYPDYIQVTSISNLVDIYTQTSEMTFDS